MWAVAASHKKLPGPLGSYDSLNDPHLVNYFLTKTIRQRLQKSQINSKGRVQTDVSFWSSRENNLENTHQDAETQQDSKSSNQQTKGKRFKVKRSKHNKVECKSMLGGELSGDESDTHIAKETAKTSSADRQSRLTQTILLHTVSPYLLPVIPNNSFFSTAWCMKKWRKQPQTSRRSKSATGRLENAGNIHPDTSTKPFSIQSKSSDSQSEPIASFPRTLCKVTLLYHGNLRSSRSWFGGRDDTKHDIHIWQQHCGGNPITVYRNSHHCGEQLMFTSWRHIGYPFSLTIFVDGLRDLTVSTCCEYRHPTGSRLGGKRGHFTLLDVSGGKPCYRCQVEATLGPMKVEPHHSQFNSQKTKSLQQCATKIKKLIPRNKTRKIRPSASQNSGKDVAAVKSNYEEATVVNTVFEEYNQPSSGSGEISEEEKWSTSDDGDDDKEIQEDIEDTVSDQHNSNKVGSSVSEELVPQETVLPVQQTSKESSSSLKSEQETIDDTISVEDKTFPSESLSIGEEKTETIKVQHSNNGERDPEREIFRRPVPSVKNCVQLQNNIVEAKSSISEQCLRERNSVQSLTEPDGLFEQRIEAATTERNSQPCKSSADWGSRKKLFKRQGSTSSEDEVNAKPAQNSVTVLVDVHTNPPSGLVSGNG